MSISPAFQWYPKDILASARVAEMTLEEEGAYRRALDFCWVNGSISADPEKLARMIGKGCSTVVATVVQSMFVFDVNDPSRMIHERLQAEREKQNEWSEKSRQGGLKSAETRRNKAKSAENTNKSGVSEELKGGSNLVEPNGNSSSSSPIKEKQTKDAANAACVREVFEQYKKLFKKPNTQLDAKRRKRISARLSEGLSAEQLKKSLRGVLLSPWHRGENPTKTVYDKIDTIFRDREQVEKFIELVDQNEQKEPELSEEAKLYLAYETANYETFHRGGSNVRSN